MAITVEGTPTQTSASSANQITINVPSGLQDDDVLVFFIACSDNQTISDVSGTLTQYVQEGSGAGDDRQIAVFYKIIIDSGLEPSNYTFTAALGLNYSGGALILRGVDLDNPEDCPEGTSNLPNQTSLICPSINTINDNAFVLCGGVATEAATNYTPPGDVDEQIDVAILDASSCLGTYTQASHGSTGTKTWSYATEKTPEVTSFQCAFKPAPEPSYYTTYMTPTGTQISWTWNSGQYDTSSGMRATSDSPTIWEWAVISSSSSYFYPSGGPNGWKWISGSCGA